jgi:NAD(P)-dependent dehydrogenase (short-subunit alcohol dehydrogenase family)
MACRSESKCNQAIEKLKKEIKDPKVSFMALDTSSLDSVRAFSKTFLATHEKLDFLMCNSGIMALPNRKTSVDGFELQLATNHLGHFLLVGLLMPLLAKTPGSRIVTHSSSANWFGKFDWDDLNCEKTYARWDQYQMTKLANVTFAVELQRRLKEKNLAYPTSYAAHPGYVFGQLQTNSGGGFARLVLGVLSWFGGTYETGSYPSEYALTSPDAEPAGLYGPNGIYGGIFAGDSCCKVAPNKLALDVEVGKKLWEVSEKMTGFKFEL